MASEEFMKKEHDKFVRDLIRGGMSAQHAKMHWDCAMNMLGKLGELQAIKKDGERG